MMMWLTLLKPDPAGGCAAVGAEVCVPEHAVARTAKIRPAEVTKNFVDRSIRSETTLKELRRVPEHEIR